MKPFIERGLKLGFGLMRLPKLEDGKSFDIEQVKQMVDAFIASGGTYFDTAYVYGGSEEATREALCSRYPRDSYYLASKINAATWAAEDRDACYKQIQVSLARSGAGYFDFYMLHGLDPSNYKRFEEFGMWDYIKSLKEKGLIRHWGFSFHGAPEDLDRLLAAHPDTEFVQLQINYADWNDPVVASRQLVDISNAYGVPVVVMEPVKGGTLANPPEAAQQVLEKVDPDASPAGLALRFAASQPGIAMVLSGMSTLEQMQENLSVMQDFQPLSPEEQELLLEAGDVINRSQAIACTSCHYCTPGCPADMHIPEIFKIWNEYYQYQNFDRAKRDYGWRPGGPRASECIGCGQCEDACPQHLPIIQTLAEIAEAFE